MSKSQGRECECHLPHVLLHATVEEIQNAVEKTLIEKGHAQTAKNYILYRANRTRAREMKTSLMEIYKDLTFKDAKDNDIKRENANIDGDTAMGTMLKYGSEGAKQFNKLFVLRPEHAKAHEEGDIHIHDLDFLTLTEHDLFQSKFFQLRFEFLQLLVCYYPNSPNTHKPQQQAQEQCRGRYHLQMLLL